jgi:DNA-binding GntR family transcriptional regulator
MPEISKINHRSKTDLVYQILKDAVIDLHWRPGEKRSISDLSALLNVSRSPVAEACKILEKEGWVIIKPQVGVEVAQLSKEEIEENFKIRGVLEGLAGMVALPHLGKTDVSSLQQHLTDMEKAQKNKDLSSFIEQNHAFHRLICQASKMPQLINILEHFWDASKRYRVFFRHLPNVLEDSNMNHKKILSALKEGNILSLRMAIEKDSWDFGEKLTKYLAKGESGIHFEHNHSPLI